LNQILAKKLIGGTNWVKTITKLNHAHSNKKNKIIDFIHWITTKIVNENDEIYVGNVNSKLGLKNKRHAKTIADQYWYEIKRQLKYKSDWYDKTFEIVDEKYTSVTCNKCNWQIEKLSLGLREWTCPECGTVHDRDINAAINIRTVGTTGIAFGKTNILVSGLGNRFRDRIYGSHKL
jgi:putative transposase